jgi:predicted metal-dependent RNase
MNSKAIKTPYIQFVGENSEDVTQSMTLIKYNCYNIMVDCGLYQSTNVEYDYKINSTFNKAVKPKQIDAIIITHHHLDHIGRLPMLYKRGCICPTFIPKHTKGVISVLLQDSVKIFEHDYDKFGRQPIYLQEDVDLALSHMIECESGENIEINDMISFIYYSAQHIPRAQQIYLTLNDGINIKKIGFTGDISIDSSNNYINDFQSLPQVDILIGENTYNTPSRLHKSKDRKKDVEKLELAIKTAKDKKSKVIIPTFANARSQDILTTLYKMYDGKCPLLILMDSTLCRNITNEYDNVICSNMDLWDKVKDWNGYRWVNDYKEREAWSKFNEPMIVVCSGGISLQSGTGTFWVRECLGNSKNRIVFTGYSSPESVAGKIKNGDIQQIKIDGRTVKNRASITILNSFGSHMDYKQLLDYYTTIQYNKICLVHGNMSDKIKFCEKLKKELSKVDRTSRVVCVQKDTKVHF